jgi:beta-mannosidase
MAGKTVHDLSELSWTLWGYAPYAWGFFRTLELGLESKAEIRGVPARVPGSVQMALLEAGLLPDWMQGLESRACEWVENRHWIYRATLPAEWLAGGGEAVRLVCDGLDGFGLVRLNGTEVGSFRNAHRPHVFDLTGAVEPDENHLEIVFTESPRWLGQYGRTSEMTAWKPRFNYTWDWTPRIMQIGVWDSLTLEIVAGAEIGELDARAGFDVEAGRGRLRLCADVRGGAVVQALLEDERGRPVRRAELPAAAFAADGVRWTDLEVAAWWPNGAGEHPLYTLRLRLLDEDGAELDSVVRRLGFRQVEWRPCEGAPAGAPPYLCAVNGRALFLQGVNWTPIRPTFADVGLADIRARLETYQQLGCNLLRVWGGAVLESEAFYNLCDELGLLVWQEFPLSSSGLENWPPEDPEAIEEMAEIATSYVRRRRHHPALLCWCGGNELMGDPGGRKCGARVPVDESHPMIGRLAEVVRAEDPDRRFLPASAAGPSFQADPEAFGQGLHWDVHGPWRLPAPSETLAARYWREDDALFRSEVGHPGASPADVIRDYSGGLPVLPPSLENPLWARTSWWVEIDDFRAEFAREPESLAEYVEWSQQRQAAALALAARACKSRFPRCGGILIWMGHDCFPCTANTAILDVHGRPKPAAWALKGVFSKPPEQVEPV